MTAQIQTQSLTCEQREVVDQLMMDYHERFGNIMDDETRSAWQYGFLTGFFIIEGGTLADNIRKSIMRFPSLVTHKSIEDIIEEVERNLEQNENVFEFNYKDESKTVLFDGFSLLDFYLDNLDI